MKMRKTKKESLSTLSKILENQALNGTENLMPPSCYLFLIRFKVLQMHSEDKTSVSSDSRRENV